MPGPPKRLLEENTLFEVLPAAVVLLPRPPNREPPAVDPPNRVVPFAPAVA